LVRALRREPRLERPARSRVELLCVAVTLTCLHRRPAAPPQNLLLGRGIEQFSVDRVPILMSHKRSGGITVEPGHLRWGVIWGAGGTASSWSHQQRLP